MPGPLDVLFPVRLTLRALDDLHKIALASDRGLTILERLDDRAERIEELAERFMEVGERLDRRGGEMLEFGGAMEQLGRELSEQAKVMDEHAAQVEALGEQIVASIPTFEQAVTLVTPLEGAVERIGRAVDRLPGDRRRRLPPE